MFDHEVADAYRTDLAVGEQRLERAVGVEGPVEGTGQCLVEDQQVDLVHAELAGALLEAVQRLAVAVVGDPDLGLEEDRPNGRDRRRGVPRRPRARCRTRRRCRCGGSRHRGRAAAPGLVGALEYAEAEGGGRFDAVVERQVLDGGVDGIRSLHLHVDDERRLTDSRSATTAAGSSSNGMLSMSQSFRPRGELSRGSDEFRARWATHDVARRASAGAPGGCQRAARRLRGSRPRGPERSRAGSCPRTARSRRRVGTVAAQVGTRRRRRRPRTWMRCTPMRPPACFPAWPAAGGVCNLASRPAVAVWGPHHGDVATDVVEPTTRPPRPPLSRLALQFHAESAKNALAASRPSTTIRTLSIR